MKMKKGPKVPKIKSPAKYKDSSNGIGESKYWNMISNTPGKIPQNYQESVLPMKNDK